MQRCSKKHIPWAASGLAKPPNLAAHVFGFVGLKTDWQILGTRDTQVPPCPLALASDTAPKPRSQGGHTGSTLGLPCLAPLENQFFHHSLHGTR